MEIIRKSSGVCIGAALAAIAFIVFQADPALAQSSIQAGVDAAHGNGQPTELFGDGGVITTVTNVLLFIVGALSVIMIIWGGLRYVISGGNSASVTAAKNTIMYAIIGLIIAFLAFAIINWIIGAVDPSGGGSAGTNV